MKSGCLLLAALASWPDDEPDASSITASSPNTASLRTQRAHRFANMVISSLEYPNATRLNFAASQPFEHRRSRLSRRNPAKRVGCTEPVSLAQKKQEAWKLEKRASAMA